MTVGKQALLQKRSELRVFLVLSVILAPLLSVAAVGGYGFAVWMYQMVAGPPSVATISKPVRLPEHEN